MIEFRCPEHTGRIIPKEGWFLVELWASGKIGVIGDEPAHPYCPPIPFGTKTAAEAARTAQKPMCAAAGNTSPGTFSREKYDLVIAHDVWDHDWLRRALERPSIRERMIYLLPEHLVEDAKKLFEASCKKHNDDWDE